MTERIRQIIPCEPGWYAMFSMLNEQGILYWSHRRIICWGLSVDSTDEDEEYVIPIMMTDGYGRRADDDVDFSGVFFLPEHNEGEFIEKDSE